MTLLSDTSKVNYVADGSATEFPVPFKFDNNADGTAEIKVYFGDGDNIEVLTENTDYTVEGSGAEITGKVVFASAPAENSKLAILRNKPLLQEADYVNGQLFDMEELENSLDGIYMAIQQLNEQISRALLVDPVSGDDPNGIVQTVLEYKNAAQQAANEALAAVAEAQEVVDKLGKLADEINGEVI